MPEPLSRLRFNLDFMPSPSPEHPGLYIRDPYRYSDAALIVPPLLVECLRCFDGQQTDLDLREMLVRLTGELEVGRLEKNLVEMLSASGFLEDETFHRMRRERHEEFARNPLREAVFAGAAYPADSRELEMTLASYFDGADGLGGSNARPLVGLAAPHVSPSGGWRSYAAAYHLLGPEHRDKIFVILATSHRGAPEKFGLTRKNFVTPFGEAQTEQPLVNWLEERAGDAVLMEDYCHSFEHTAEFQVVFLQQRLGPDVRILPVLCGAFARSLYGGGRPEDDEGVQRFFDALGELAEREAGRLVWVLGVDMAHMGARYQDDFSAIAGEGQMTEVEERDRSRIAAINSADAGGFWDQVQPNEDDLKWCGSSPFYTFLKAVPQARGELLRYEQWNIDDRSVVSFAGMAFRQG